MEKLFLYGTVLILISGIIQLFIKNQSKIFSYNLLSGLGLLLSSIPAGAVLLGQQIKDINFSISPFGNLLLVFDMLSAFFILLISIISFLSILYSGNYLKSYLKSNYSIGFHRFLMAMMIISMLWVACSQNVIQFLIVWELMSISSLFLILFEYDKKEIQMSALQYFIIMHISFLFLVIGFLSLTLTNNNELMLQNLFIKENSANIGIIYLLIGFAIKAGFIPFHIWLPKAHPSAPSHISGLMSAIMIKLGLYGIIRVFISFSDISFWIITLFFMMSLISTVFGILKAVMQTDLKRILAYSSIENIGIIGISISAFLLGRHFNYQVMEYLGLTGAFFHILNHSIYKSLLFYCAGNVYHFTHSRNIERMGGLIHKIPKTGVLFITGAIAICGLPPFNGFISEVLIYMSFFNAINSHNILLTIFSITAVTILAIIGAISIYAFIRVSSMIFLGNERVNYIYNKKEKKHPELLSLAGLIIIIGILPPLVYQLVIEPVCQFIIPVKTSLNSLGLLQSLSIYFIVFSIFVFLLWKLRTLLVNKDTTRNADIWSCGYNFCNNKPLKIEASTELLLKGRFQYTAHSHSHALTSLFVPLKKEFIIQGLFSEIIQNPLVKANKILLWAKSVMSKIKLSPSKHINEYFIFTIIFLILVLVYSSLMYKG